MKTKPPADDSPVPPESDPEARPWRAVASGVRRVLGRDVGEDERAPLGFSTRVVARWMEWRREQAAVLWRRWSFRAAALSVALALVAVLAGRSLRSGREDAGAPILPFPGLEVPLPTDSPASS